MAKKRQQNPAQTGQSTPEGFTQGMVSDLDPRFQLKGSYADAKNIRLTNSEGDTFTVENIEGNSLFVDLSTFHIDTPSDQYQMPNNESYPTFFDRGPSGTVENNYPLGNRASIVGNISFQNKIILVVVARFDWVRLPDGTRVTSNPNLSDDTQANWSNDNTEIDRTIFLQVDFDSNFNVSKVTDLRVCYKFSDDNYPDLNMDLDRPIRIEYIIENENIQRIYWTDNKNPLRTLNLQQKGLDELSISSLDITPIVKPSQPVLDLTLHGNLPVGVYQYSFKYIGEDGGESTFSPLSNMYHVSDQSFSNTSTFGGGPKGNLGSQGFQIKINGIDDNFQYIELYSLFYDTLNQPPRVAVVARQQVFGTSATFQHTNWNNEVENGLEEILIESNTFDVCKDIAIKDNILFAANLRQKRNYVSEKEWNVKVLRWRIHPGGAGVGGVPKLDAMLTCSDTQVKHYTTSGTYPNHTAVEITNGLSESTVTKDYNDDRVGHGQLLGAPSTMYNSTAYNDHDKFSYLGMLNVPMWTTYLSNQRLETGGGISAVHDYFTYRFLSDRMTLGAESFEYASNLLGGCRVTFALQEKVADQAGNAHSTPFISAANEGDQITTNYSVNQATEEGAVFKTSMSLGGSQDPYAAGDKRGYQRSDIYRFGVQTYDLNGSPGNVLWIGDIETPNQHDLVRMVDIENDNSANGQSYNPYRPTILGSYNNNPAVVYHGGATPGASLVSGKCMKSHPIVKDYRLSHIYGHAIAPPDLEWFTNRDTGGITNTDAYINSVGDNLALSRVPGPGGTQSAFKYPSTQANARNKALPVFSGGNNTYSGYNLPGHTDTHYLYDLAVVFEFIIPNNVIKKISGFRVVRAERKEDDRRIVQQGLLNQTAQYGSAEHGMKYGYDDSRFCRKDNEAFDDDPVFANEWNDQATGTLTPTLPEQPEYNVYLNGYLGLAENSHMAFYDDSVSDGKATTGGNTEGNVFFWPEREDTKKYGAGTAQKVRGALMDQGAYSGQVAYEGNGGPNVYGRHFRHSGYFGSFDKSHIVKNSETEDHAKENHNHISADIFTLDAPDSAFGIRPYSYRDGDMLRIDCVLKLSDEVRYDNQSSYSWGSNYAHHWWSHGRGISKKGQDLTGNDLVPTRYSSNGQVELWKPENTNSSLFEAMSFAGGKEIDKDYRVLVGKYYCYEPYFGIGMEITGGDFAGSGHEGGGNYKPDRQYGWQLPISAAKELSDGEIVPSGFFKKSDKIEKGRVNGFSNNTLGFCTLARTVGSGANDLTSLERHHYYVFGSVSPNLPFIGHDGNGNQTQKSDVKEEDYTYDTVSTVQMGLRTILVEINTKINEVRKYGPGPSDTFFDVRYNGVHRYNSWFAPINLGALYETSAWKAQQLTPPSGAAGGGTLADSSTYSNTYQIPLLQGFLTEYGEVGTQINGDISHDGGHTNDFSNRNKSLIPYKHLCSIVRYTTPYGGYTKGAIEKTRWIPCGNFHRVSADDPAFNNPDIPQGHACKVFGGDTFVTLYSHQKTSSPYMKKSASRFQLFPVESFVNTDMRSGLTLAAGDTVVGKNMNEPPFSNDWLYNSVYSQTNNIKSGLAVDEEEFDNSLNLPYEIAYSKTKILGQRTDAFRQFPINQFHDMEGLYGEINRIVNYKNEIYVLQDNAFAKLLVNPLSMLSDDQGTSLFTGTGETVENHIYISTKFGTRHRFSVTQSEKSLYFVDTNFARLFKYDTEKLISLGDALGQRSYLKYIIHDWKQLTHSTCQSSHPGQTHDTLYGRLNSVEKPDLDRNYLSDNPLNFLGITSIFDYNTKELMVTFHNSSFGDKNNKRQDFARPTDNHIMSRPKDGVPVGVSETLVYSEAINAFTSKYSVAPPQWIAGGSGTFILCPENEINVTSIASFSLSTGLSNSGSNFPYNEHGSNSYRFKNERCNPLKLWMWGVHKQEKKNHFFGKKGDVFERVSRTSTIDASQGAQNAYIPLAGSSGDIPDESYIVKVINSEASSSKIFDNAKVVMTPKYTNYSYIDYTTDLSHDTVDVSMTADQYGIEHHRKLDEPEQLVINNRWDFEEGMDGWYYQPNGNPDFEPVPLTVNGDSTVTFDIVENSDISSPRKAPHFRFIGKYNNIIRVKLQRTAGSNISWDGSLYWEGFKTLEYEKGNYNFVQVNAGRRGITADPGSTIESDYVILEWDMSAVGDNTAKWNDCTIERILIRLHGTTGTGTYDVDWIEIGGLKAHKYSDGTLKVPLRTEKSIRRTRGTYAKIKYRVKTTEKFNIFAILAKYRKTY